MTIFEYVSAFVSIVLGLAVADLLVSVHRLLRARRRVLWDWLTPVTAGIVLLLLVRFWWGSFQPNQKEMSIGEFLPNLVELILLFLLAAAALPDEADADGLDLRAYYEGNRAYFWTLFSAAFAWSDAQSAWFTLMRRPDLWRMVLLQDLPDLAVMLLFISLIFVRRRWWNGLVVLIALIGPAGWLSRSLG